MATSQRKNAVIAGGTIVETGSFGSPVSITTSISIPTDGRARKFVIGSPGAVVDPTLGSGSGTQELYLVGTHDTNTVELNSVSNLVLNGKIILKNGTQLVLHWVPGVSKWYEAGRNEI